METNEASSFEDIRVTLAFMSHIEIIFSSCFAVRRKLYSFWWNMRLIAFGLKSVGV